LKKVKRFFEEHAFYFFIVILVLILFFGIRPKGYNFLNGVTWLKDQAGIHLKKYGLAYTDPIFEKDENDSLYSNNFSLEIALKSEKPSINGFNFLVLIHDGDDSRQLLVAQWRSWMIVMNGDDYAHKRKTGRIAVDTALLPKGPLFLTITTGNYGTKLYGNGKFIQENKNLTLTIPNGRQSRLIVGNSVYGNRSWEGDIFGLAIYKKTLDSKDIEFHFDHWNKAHNFGYARALQPFVLYTFDERDGRLARNHASDNHHLNIPERMKILKSNILEAEWDKFEYDSNHIRDFWLNLLGFLPFGFSLSAVLIRFRGGNGQQLVLKTVLLGFLVSLVIELAQAWMPSRSSSLSDLILNTCGTLLGSLGYSRVFAAGKGIRK
jgi:VanZ family protein